MTEYILFGDTRYPVRDILLAQYEVTVKVSCESLWRALTDEEGEYVSREAQLIDELMFFYVPDSLITDGADEDLEAFVYDHLAW